MQKIKLKLILLLFLLWGQFLNIANADEIVQVNLTAKPKVNNGEIIFSQKEYPVDAIDPTILTNTSASFYPGLRGAGQMVIYTPLYGTRTNTNEFGGEAIINGNVVTALSGADSIIPSDGLVISGHGGAKKWMNENIILGSKVYVNKDTKNLTVYVTSDSFLYGAKAKIKESEEIINFYKQNSYLYDYKTPCAYIDKAREYVEKAEKDPKNVQKHSAHAVEAANSALAHSLPFRPDELRGVWVRPTETTEAEIVNTLEKIKAAGIDSIFLETYFHGKTIFPSKTMQNYQFIAQNEKFLGFDPLKIWITEAHKRNMKVNIWFETFYVGNQNPANNSKSIIAVNPSWANTTKKNYSSDKPTPSISEHNGYFIDPSNPDVQDFLEELITEIICNYCPDGINLDYIRYPQSISAKFPGYELSNWGYTEYARTDFKSKYGKDPVELTSSDELWPIWCKYRQDKISEFVMRICNITRAKNVLLTAVIFPDRQKALETKQQDWKTWSKNNYIDGFTPLLLTCDSKTANTMMSDVIRNKDPRTALYAGLFITFMGGSNEDLLRQIHEARKIDAKGVIVFDYAHLADNYAETLTACVFDDSKTLSPQLQCNTQGNVIKYKRWFFIKRGVQIRG